MIQGIRSFPIATTIGSEQLKYMINKTEMVCVFCTEDMMVNIEEVHNDCPSLKVVVLFTGEKVDYDFQGIEIYNYRDLPIIVLVF